MIRAAEASDRSAVRGLVIAAFGPGPHGGTVAELVDALRASGHVRGELVATDDSTGELLGHVLLSHSWVDADRRLVDVWVLSPLAVRPDRQGEGMGTALVAAAIRLAAGAGVPALFLEGDPRFYATRGFERATAHGFTAPSTRIPDVAFQVVVLDAREPWMTGALVYCDPFWALDCVGLRPAD